MSYLTIAIANGLQARIHFDIKITSIWISPSALADDIPFAVTDVPVRLLQVLRLAGVVVNFQEGQAWIGRGQTSEVTRQESNWQNHICLDHLEMLAIEHKLINFKFCKSF